MLVVFSPVFVARTKIIFVYNFVAPLNVKKGNKINHIFKNLFLRNETKLIIVNFILPY